jgi:hypothetical protein
MEGLTINPVEKEFVPFLTFFENDVLDKQIEKIHRSQLLHMAMILGNCFKNKVTIVFKSLEGINKVSATIWASTDESVVLKGGTTIPIKSIMDVRIY